MFFRKNTVKTRILEGLLYILRQLLASYDGSIAFGYLPYNDAYGIFCGFMEREVEAKEFRNHLLHEEYGLCVYVIKVLDNRDIILQNDTVAIDKFLLELDQLLSKDKADTFSRFDLNVESLKRVLQSMDSEYDKSVLKAMIFATASRKKIQELGIKPDHAVNLLNKVVTASTECERANEAEDILKLRDGEKLKVIDEKITAIDKILSKRESLISERKKADLIAEKSSLEDRKEGIQKDLRQSDP